MKPIFVLGALAAALSLPARAEMVFDDCVAGLETQAKAQGVSADSYRTHTQGLLPDMSVLELLDAQPEFTTPLWDYLAALVDEQRVTDGQTMLATHRELLAQVAERYGVRFRVARRRPLRRCNR